MTLSTGDLSPAELREIAQKYFYVRGGVESRHAQPEGLQIVGGRSRHRRTRFGCIRRARYGRSQRSVWPSDTLNTAVPHFPPLRTGAGPKVQPVSASPTGTFYPGRDSDRP